MRSWFARPVATEPAVSGNELGAYKAGRADERGNLQQDSSHADRAASEAYERGLREKRLRHRGSPLLALLTIILVLMALTVLVLAVKTGSFSNAGAVLDNLIRPPVNAAAEKAGSALEDAGKTIKNNAGASHP